MTIQNLEETSNENENNHLNQNKSKFNRNNNNNNNINNNINVFLEENKKANETINNSRSRKYK